MDNYPIKSVTFGGFDKQDVARYIEQSAQQTAEMQSRLQSEIDMLSEQNRDLTQKLSALEQQLEEVTTQRDQLQGQLENDVAQLKSENESLHADADAYVQFRDRLGAIECDARKRADDLEAATLAQLRQTVDLFRQQYQVLMSTFESTAGYVTGELRKVEVNLSQLPRAMDQAGNELNELAAQLKRDEI